MNKADSCKLPYALMLGIALVQGLALLALNKALELQLWPHGEPVWLYPLSTLAIVTPVLALLALCRESLLRTALWLAPFSALCALLAAYTGWQAEPADVIRATTIAAPFALALAIACFKALMYIQQLGTGEPFGYAALFRHSWRNFLVLGLGLLFMLIFWGILKLWAALFEAIGIEFFAQLFRRDWFLFPVLALANGIAILVFRNLSAVIDVIARILQAMIKFLLPLLVAVSLMFLATLPFTGLQALWDTGKGSLLVLWLQALTLFFLNAVYQDEHRESPYPLPLHRFIYIGTALLPVYSAIALYGLSLRVAQYGWSVERCWGVLIGLLLALFALGYCWGIVRRRDAWITTLSRVNVSMGLVVLAAMLAVNSPLVDFRKLSLASQFERLARDELTPETLDIPYIAQHLGRPGYLALQAFKTDIGDSHPQIVADIDALYRPRSTPVLPEPARFGEELFVWPPDTRVPDGLTRALHQWMERKVTVLDRAPDYALIAMDLNDDGEPEYVSVQLMPTWGQAQLWRRRDGEWVALNMYPHGTRRGGDIRRLAENGDIRTRRPPWKQLDIGGLIFRVEEPSLADE